MYVKTLVRLKPVLTKNKNIQLQNYITNPTNIDTNYYSTKLLIDQNKGNHKRSLVEGGTCTRIQIDAEDTYLYDSKSSTRKIRVRECGGRYHGPRNRKGVLESTMV